MHIFLELPAGNILRKYLVITLIVLVGGAGRAKKKIAWPRCQGGHRISVFSPEERSQLSELINNKPDITLDEIRQHFQKSCSLPAIHKIVCKLGYVLKKDSASKRTRQRGCTPES